MDVQVVGRPVLAADSEHQEIGASHTYEQVWSCEYGCGFTSEDFNDVVIHERSAHQRVGVREGEAHRSRHSNLYRVT